MMNASAAVLGNPPGRILASHRNQKEAQLNPNVIRSVGLW